MPTSPPVPPPAPPAALSVADLAGLSREDLIALVVTLDGRVRALEDTLASARTTSRNSSKPPSSDQGAVIVG